MDSNGVLIVAQALDGIVQERDPAGDEVSG
jgi:hypothetical protein